MSAASALPCALALLATLSLAGCSWLAGVGGPGSGDDGASWPAPTDAGHLRDGGVASDAGYLVDASGPDDDAGEAPDASVPLDDGGDDAGEPGHDDAGEPGHDDAGEPGPDDAGEPGLDDAGAPDAGLASRARVLASGSGFASVTAQLDGAALAEVDAVLLFLARERIAVVGIPGDWSSSDYKRRSSGGERVVGATRYLQEEPTTLGTSISIEVESGERFSYALIGVTGAEEPRDSAASDDNSKDAAACADGPASHHKVKLSYAFYGVTAVAHLRPAATVPSPGRLLVAVEPAEGPSLIVQELEGPANTDVELRVCLGGAGPFVSLAHGFDLD